MSAYSFKMQLGNQIAINHTKQADQAPSWVASLIHSRSSGRMTPQSMLQSVICSQQCVLVSKGVRSRVGGCCQMANGPPIYILDGLTLIPRIYSEYSLAH